MYVSKPCFQLLKPVTKKEGMEIFLISLAYYRSTLIFRCTLAKRRCYFLNVALFIKHRVIFINVALFIKCRGCLLNVDRLWLKIVALHFSKRFRYSSLHFSKMAVNFVKCCSKFMQNLLNRFFHHGVFHFKH